MANEFYFLPEIIQNVQAFLNARYQAQSSILSKSWYISCPTRPVLAFDENKILCPTKDFFAHKFSEFCTETLHRYKTKNLKLDKFTLKMKILGGEVKSSPRNRLAGELITSALELGVSEIKLMLNYWYNSEQRYDLPAQVFASTSLTRLTVERYVIDGVVGDRVLCSRLKSLVLYNVKTKDDVVRDILARCPLIENLDLRHCVGIDKLNVSKLINLVEFRYTKGLMVNVEFLNFGMNVIEFRCLRRLELKKVRIGAEFFTMFGSMFPCIEELMLGYCEDYEEISISSHSLRRLTLHQWERLTKVQLNVPNISKFVFEAGTNDVNELVHIKIKDEDIDDSVEEWNDINEAGLDNISEDEDIDDRSDEEWGDINGPGLDNINEASLDNMNQVAWGNINGAGLDNINEDEDMDDSSEEEWDNINEASSVKVNDFKPLPSISFDNVPINLECDMYVWWKCEVVEASSFADLKKFLTQFTHSNISLDVRFTGKRVTPGEEIPCLLPVVEKLKVCTCFSWVMKKNLLLGLSKSCCANSVISVCNECLI